MLGPPCRGVAGDAALGSDTRPRPPASSAWVFLMVLGTSVQVLVSDPFSFDLLHSLNSFFLGCGSALLLPGCPVARSRAGAGG